MPYYNQYRQPIGDEIAEWQGAQLPAKTPISGQYCRLEPISVAAHSQDLFTALNQAEDKRDWTYLLSGPFESLTEYQAYLTGLETLSDPLHFAIIDRTTQRAIGSIALMRIAASAGVIEIGSVTYSPQLKRTRLATEAITLLLHYTITELGYRRVEWKCDSLNQPSRNAALRLGFTFEGVFRQALVVRGHNRDTAWFSIIDRDYPALRAAYLLWLSAENFDATGQQRQKLSEFIARTQVVETTRSPALHP